MPFFEFHRPDKSPQNARMPKRKKAKNLQKEQPTHTPHPHNKIPPKFRQKHDCTLQVSHVHRCQVSARSNLHPEVSQCVKIQGFGLPKRPSKFPPTQQSTPKFHNALKSEVSDYLKRPSKFPPTQQSTPKFHNTPKSKVSGYLKQPSKFPYTHEVREFLSIQRPNAPNQTPTPHPRSILGSLIASKIPTFQGKISHLGVSTYPPPTPPRTGGNPSVCVPKNA